MCNGRATLPRVGNSGHKNPGKLAAERGTSLAEIADCEAAATNSGCRVPDAVRAGGYRTADDRAHPAGRSAAIQGPRRMFREGWRMAAAGGGTGGVDRRV